MFGNFEQDSDRFVTLRQLTINFLRELGYGENLDDENLEQALNAPENADALVGTGSGEDATPEDRNRKDRLDLWARQLQRAGVLPKSNRLLRSRSPPRRLRPSREPFSNSRTRSSIETKPTV